MHLGSAFQCEYKVTKNNPDGQKTITKKSEFRIQFKKRAVLLKETLSKRFYYIYNIYIIYIVIDY